MTLLTFPWVTLTLIALVLSFWIVCIQCFGMYGNAVKRCGEKGGACEDLLYNPASDIHGIPPSVLAFALLGSIVTITVARFEVTLLGLIFSGICGAVSLYYLGYQILVRQYCSICNAFHLASVTLAGVSAVILFRQRPELIWMDIGVAALVFGSVVAALVIAMQLSEKMDQAQQDADVYRTLLQREGHRNLAGLSNGQPVSFPCSNVIALTHEPANDRPKAIVALSIGCHFCAEILEWVLTHHDKIQQHWVLSLIFVDSKVSEPANAGAAAVILENCKSMPTDLRVSYLRDVILPFLHEESLTIEQLWQSASKPDEVSVVGVPVLPFSPALVVNSVFLDENINFPKQILSLPLGVVEQV